MNNLHLAKVFNKKDTKLLLEKFSASYNQSFAIYNTDGKLLFGDNDDYAEESPVFVDDELFGWVKGDSAVTESIADLIAYLLAKELEKKELARETLGLYKEINLLYNLAEKIKANFNISEIAQSIIDQATLAIKSTSATVMLYNDKLDGLEIVASVGDNPPNKRIYQKGKGIAGHVFLSGKAEVINNTCDDIRYIKNCCAPGSLLCAPIKTSEKTIGVINLSHNHVINYTAADLKLFCTLVSQGAIALENAILHANKIKEEKVKSHLERYVSEQVVHAIMDAGDKQIFSPEKRYISILFSDIRGFTNLCEHIDSKEIVDNLNTYFENMVDIIFTEQGTINKFVGDMIVALFGAPEVLQNSEKHTVMAAISMQNWLKQTEHKWINQNFKTGIGINSGEVIIGNIGSPKHMDYTAIGDEINLASRLQSLAKGGQILASRSVYDATKDFFDYRYQGPFSIRGKEKSVDVYEVIY
ncbi:MAG: adenylate/guanylate cyclase domain-containing protein [Gammaproteobacteria bacterium]